MVLAWRSIMTHSHMTHWIEDAEAREVILQGCRFQVVLPEESQYLHLGSTIAKVSAWWHHNVTRDVLPYHYSPRNSTRH
jgi:hypothetical protein